MNVISETSDVTFIFNKFNNEKYLDVKENPCLIWVKILKVNSSGFY